jgi:hypothetical protein
MLEPKPPFHRDTAQTGRIEPTINMQIEAHDANQK